MQRKRNTGCIVNYSYNKYHRSAEKICYYYDVHQLCTLRVVSADIQCKSVRSFSMDNRLWQLGCRYAVLTIQSVHSLLNGLFTLFQNTFSNLAAYMFCCVYSTVLKESYFHWLFGALEPDYFGTVDVDSGKATLFIPRLHESYLVWSGQ